MFTKRHLISISLLALMGLTLACGLQPVVVTEYIIITTTPENVPPPPEEQQLVPTFQDDFEDASFDTILWTLGTNSGDSSYGENNGFLSLGGGTTNGGGIWVLSNQLFTPNDTVQVFEALIQVTNNDGGLWGFWGDDHEGYLMFGVSETGQLQAWVRLNRDAPLQSIDVNGVDITEWHTYRIEFTSIQAKFYVDDVLVATHTDGVPAGKPMHLRLDRVSWGQNEFIRIEYVECGEYR